LAEEKPVETVLTTQSVVSAAASTNAEPTEAEMRDALQRHLDSINSQMRSPPSARPSPGPQPYRYSPYWHFGYHYRYSKESDYENWTDVAKRAAAQARVQIASFKKIRCTPAPEHGGFLCQYVAELELRGNSPLAQEIMQTSGRSLEVFFYRGDKGWICGEPKTETK
jgi:hypothetical protein